MLSGWLGQEVRRKELGRFKSSVWLGQEYDVFGSTFYVFITPSDLCGVTPCELVSLCTFLPTYGLSSMSYYEICPTFFYSKAQLSIVINSHTVTRPYDDR